jgi:hypothetical protein
VVRLSDERFGRIGSPLGFRFFEDLHPILAPDLQIIVIV